MYFCSKSACRYQSTQYQVIVERLGMQLQSRIFKGERDGYACPLGTRIQVLSHSARMQEDNLVWPRHTCTVTRIKCLSQRHRHACTVTAGCSSFEPKWHALRSHGWKVVDARSACMHGHRAAGWLRNFGMRRSDFGWAKWHACYGHADEGCRCEIGIHALTLM